MCALAYYLERDGILTTGISLVRENAQSIRPPRMLWVSFPLGRPLGKPGDAPFQHRVIAAALDLLNRDSGPVLEDYPEDAPAAETATAPVCPVSFAKPESAAATWTERLTTDLARVMPWYDLSRRRRGRTLVGISDRSPKENMLALGRLLDAGQLPANDLKWFKHAIEDLKVLYLEALTAQPGDYDPEQTLARFWQDSALGAALIHFYHLFQSVNDRSLNQFARIVVPREAVGERTGEALLFVKPQETN